MFIELPASSEQINTFYKEKRLDNTFDHIFFDNDYVILKNESQSALARYEQNLDCFLPLVSEHIYDIAPKNKEQHAYMDALLRDDIKCIAVTGPAGSGKTLLAITVAIYQVLEEKKFKQILITKPNISISRAFDVGFLKGSLEDKIDPHLDNFYDNIEQIFINEYGDSIQYLKDKEIVKALPMAFVRGRNLRDRIVIIDEAQALSRHEMKTLLSRIAETSKVIVAGDPTQVDRPEVMGENNGLARLTEAFRGLPWYARIELKNVLRGGVAQAAVELL